MGEVDDYCWLQGRSEWFNAEKPDVIIPGVVFSDVVRTSFGHPTMEYAFNILDRFNEKNIPSVLEGMIHELVKDREYWIQFMKDNPRTGVLLKSEDFELRIRSYFTSEEDFKNDAEFQRSFELYKYKCGWGPPGCHDFQLYADKNALLQHYPNVKITSEEELQRRRDEGAAFRRAFFSGDVKSLGSLLAGQVNSLGLKEKVSEEDAEQIASLVLMHAEKNY